MSLLIVSLDNSIVNVALPSIRKELGASVSGLQWTISAYTLVLASLLMLSGSLADRFGRRRIFQLGLVLFTLGSLLCSIAPGLGWLIAFRMIQAVGGSMLNPVAMSIIVNTFSDRKERARAIGFWGAVVGVSLALGPVLGGILTSTIGWRSIFWVNVPVGIAAIVLSRLFVPESRAARARRFDPAAQLLIIVILGSVVYAIIEGPSLSWDSPIVIGLFVLAALALVAFILVERRRTEPLVDLRFFRSVPFSGALIIAVAGFAFLAGFLFLNTLYLQDVRGFTPLHAGLFTLPMAVLTAIAAPLSGRLVASTGARLPLILAGSFILVGSVLLVGLAPGTPIPLLVVTYVMVGFGFGLVNAPISNTAVSGMPRAQSGVAAGIASTGRQVGSTLGVGIVGSLLAGGMSGNVGFTDASHAAFAVLAGLGLIVLIGGVVSTGRGARATAERVASLLDDSTGEGADVVAAH